MNFWFSLTRVSSIDIDDGITKTSNGSLSLKVIRTDTCGTNLYTPSLPKERYWNLLSFGMWNSFRCDSVAKDDPSKCDWKIADWWLLMVLWMFCCQLKYCRQQETSRPTFLFEFFFFYYTVPCIFVNYIICRRTVLIYYYVFILF